MRSFFLIICLCLGLISSTSGQSAAVQKEASALASDGEDLIREGRYAEAASALARADKLHPGQAQVRVRLAEAQFLLKDYAACEATLSSLLKAKNPPVETYQLMGNCKDEQGNPKSAMIWYQNGLDRYPDSGMLYMEMGISEYAQGWDTQALVHWEEGIKREPLFSGNYYLAAKLHFSKQDYAWAVIFAEMLIHLERKGEKVTEMSKLVFDCYRLARRQKTEGGFEWRFEGPDKVGDLHYALNEAFAASMTETDSLMSIAGLMAPRRFAAFFVPQRDSHPVSGLLFSWQQRVADAGHFEAYHYWLLYDAEPGEFKAWYNLNGVAYEAFENWYYSHPFADRLR